MTTKLKDYGITGPWSMETCDDCGKLRSCLVAQGEDETFAWCVLCLIKDIERMERAQERMVL